MRSKSAAPPISPATVLCPRLRSLFCPASIRCLHGWWMQNSIQEFRPFRPFRPLLFGRYAAFAFTMQGPMRAHALSNGARKFLISKQVLGQKWTKTNTGQNGKKMPVKSGKKNAGQKQRCTDQTGPAPSRPDTGQIQYKMGLILVKL